MHTIMVEFFNGLRNDIHTVLKDKYNTPGANKRASKEWAKILNVSDITYCFRKAMFDRIYNKPKTLQEALNFDRGLQFEEYVIDSILSKVYSGYEFERQTDLEHFDKIYNPDYKLVGHPDFVIPELDLIIEIKNTNFPQAITLETPYIKSYLRQLVMYLILTGYENGAIVIYQNFKLNNTLNDDDSPYIGIKLTIMGSDPIRSYFKSQVYPVLIKEFRKVMTTKQFNRIPRVLEYPKANKCQTCKYKKECDETVYDNILLPDKNMLEKVLLGKWIDNAIQRMNIEITPLQISESAS